MKTSRIHEWWASKAGNLLSIIFIIVAVCDIPFSKTIIYFLPSLITIVGIGAFGHIVNDWLDISSDAKAGKKNRMAGFSPSKRFFIALLSLVIALLPWIILPFDQISIIILSIEFLLLIIYAVPPFRFKERAFLGVLSDGLYAYAMPAMLAAYTYYLIAENYPIDIVLLSIIFIWQVAMGIHNIMIHQIEDYENDLKAKANTFVVAKGLNQNTLVIKKYFHYLEIIAFITFIFYISWQYEMGYFILPVLILLIKYIPLIFLMPLAYYHTSTKSEDLQIVNIYYHKFLPFCNLLFCVLFQLEYLWFLPFTWILLRNNSIKANGFIRRGLSIMVNYPIFWYRLYILKQDESVALGESYDKEIFGEIKERKDGHTIAIVNRNAAKYTETFVKNHIDNLPFNIKFYYGRDSYFPEFGARGFLVSNFKFPQLFYQHLSKKKNLSDKYFLKKAFQKELVHQKVDLVLAEFGTIGAAISSTVKDVNIPLVCIFYGYDAFHQKTLDLYKEEYQELFNNAKLLIGVSKDIVFQLEKLGAPKEKIQYLPCALNLERFQYSDHSKNPPIFLAVGRFAETKSPHLTILAFKEVLKTVPNAQLIMVGKDEGYLHEACLILVKALGIENHVEFKGILNHDEVFQQMKQARIFIQHSLTTPIYHDKEGTPVAIMEAMSSGLPVISTRHAGIEEMIEHEKTGFLVDEYDIENMAKYMVLLAQNDQLVHDLGKNASQFIPSHSLVSKHTDILSSLIKQTIIKHNQ